MNLSLNGHLHIESLRALWIEHQEWRELLFSFGTLVPEYCKSLTKESEL